MKKILFFVVCVILFWSCGLAKHTTYLNDFRPYLEKDFIFSAHDINNKYTPLGDIKIVATSYQLKKEVGRKVVIKNANKELDPVYGDKRDITLYQNSDMEMMTTLVYKKCQSLGANGMLFFKIRYVKGIYVATGMLVKIEK